MPQILFLVVLGLICVVIGGFVLIVSIIRDEVYFKESAIPLLLGALILILAEAFLFFKVF